MLRKILKGITLGGIAGFVLGLLFAPQKGEETRKKLQESLEKGKEKFKELKDDIEKTQEEGEEEEEGDEGKKEYEIEQ